MVPWQLPYISSIEFMIFFLGIYGLCTLLLHINKSSFIFNAFIWFNDFYDFILGYYLLCLLCEDSIKHHHYEFYEFPVRNPYPYIWSIRENWKINFYLLPKKIIMIFIFSISIWPEAEPEFAPLFYVTSVYAPLRYFFQFISMQPNKRNNNKIKSIQVVLNSMR